VATASMIGIGGTSGFMREYQVLLQLLDGCIVYKSYQSQRAIIIPTSCQRVNSSVFGIEPFECSTISAAIYIFEQQISMVTHQSSQDYVI
jgi:hypothetical protein